MSILVQFRVKQTTKHPSLICHIWFQNTKMKMARMLYLKLHDAMYDIHLLYTVCAFPSLLLGYTSSGILVGKIHNLSFDLKYLDKHVD